MTLPLPPKSFNIIGIFIILFILQTGIIYLVIRDASSMSQDVNENPIFIYPEDVYEAFIIESIVASILIILFSMGFVLIYHASKYVYNKKFADWILVIGILLIFIAFGLLQLMLRVKAPKLFEKIE